MPPFLFPGAAPGAGAFLCSPKERHERKGDPRFAAATSLPRAVSLRCSIGPAVCATRAPARLMHIHRA